jgi:hypothetical protein
MPILCLQNQSNYLAISFEIDVMNTAGLTRAILDRANLDVRQESPAAVNGSPYFELGTHQSASQHNSNKPRSTLETSRWGSHMTKPLPIRSIGNDFLNRNGYHQTEHLLYNHATFLKEPFVPLEGADCDHGTNKKHNGTSCRNLSTAFVMILLIRLGKYSSYFFIRIMNIFDLLFKYSNNIYFT